MGIDTDLWVAAEFAVTIIRICANEIALRKDRRKVWVKRPFQHRQSKGSYQHLLRELRDEDPDSFRAYLRMDIDTFYYLLDILSPISVDQNAIESRFPLGNDWL